MKYNEIEIVNRYNKGESALAIAKSFNTYNTSIRRILKRNNVLLRSLYESKDNGIDKVFLLNSAIRDYWIGYIIADGSVSLNSNKIEINCALKDKEHLQKYANWLNINLHIYRDKRFNVFCCKASFANKTVKEYLIDLGITPRKSMTIKLLGSLNRDILRGVIDGDGYIKSYKNRTCVEIASGSIEFLNQIDEFLSNNNITISSIRKAKSIYLLNIYNQKEVYKLYKLLYTNANLFMERKHDKFKATLLFKDSRTNTLNSGN
jgi:hypothetical protein